MITKLKKCEINVVNGGGFFQDFWEDVKNVVNDVVFNPIEKVGKAILESGHSVECHIDPEGEKSCVIK